MGFKGLLKAHKPGFLKAHKGLFETYKQGSLEEILNDILESF